MGEADADDTSAGETLQPGPGRPGRTVLADRVVVKIATRAAAEVSTSIPAARRSRALPFVDVDLAGRRARLRVQVASTWPEPAAGAAARARDSVRHELERQAGVSVDDIVVTVAQVRPPESPTRRVR